MNTVDIREVRAWAYEGGKMARAYFNHVARQRKPDRSWVTQADLEIEQFLREKIAASYPEHGIIGEEQGVEAVDREFVWVLDPIDGTGSFVSGLPLWCISIGLLRHGRPYLGVVYMPLLDDCYWADATGPAYRNEEVLSVALDKTIDGNDWIAVPSNVHRRFRLNFPGKTRSLGSIAAELCYVARGSALGALVSGASLWDIAGGLAILHASGGELRALSGADLPLLPMLAGSKLSEPVIAAAPSLYPMLCGYITPHAKPER